MTIQRHRTESLPLLLTDLTLRSCETIALRSLLIVQNKCSPAEYQRMLTEKLAAAMESGLILMFSGGRASTTDLLAPWISRATANSKRLQQELQQLDERERSAHGRGDGAK